MEEIYHIKIKKEYATKELERLKKDEAIEFVEDQIPEWQKQEGRKRLQQMKDNPESVVSEEDFNAYLKQLKDEDEI